MTLGVRIQTAQPSKRTWKLSRQRERECVYCGRVFSAKRKGNVRCSMRCNAEANLLISVLRGESDQYASLPARLSAESGQPGTAIGLAMRELDRRREARAQAVASGELSPKVRASLSANRRRLASHVEEPAEVEPMMVLVAARTDRLRPPKLGHRQRAALDLVQGMPGALTVAGLAETLGMRYTHTRQMVEALEERGLLTLEPRRQDR